MNGFDSLAMMGGPTMAAADMMNAGNIINGMGDVSGMMGDISNLGQMPGMDASSGLWGAGQQALPGADAAGGGASGWDYINPTTKQGNNLWGGIGNTAKFGIQYSYMNKMKDMMNDQNKRANVSSAQNTAMFNDSQERDSRKQNLRF